MTGAQWVTLIIAICGVLHGPLAVALVNRLRKPADPPVSLPHAELERSDQPRDVPLGFSQPEARRVPPSL